MIPYLRLLDECWRSGVRQKNRTGVDTIMIPGGMMQFNMDEGFPILTTKKVNFDAVKAELIGFIRGYTSAADFRKLGCKIWDANANENKPWLMNPYRKGEDDLGRIYGAQWRAWRHAVKTDPPSHYQASHQVAEMDQLANALELVRGDPTSRRIIVGAWNPGETHQMALPPCHLLWQLLVEQEKKKLHMTMYMRSCDMFLGVPFNISSYALLLSLIAKVMGYAPGKLTMFLADVHIYENHLDQVKEQRARTPRSRPTLHVDHDNWGETPLQWLETIDPGDISLIDYDPHPPIKAAMAV